MPTISVRISKKEKEELLKYGILSTGLREGLRLYLNTQKSRKLLHKLEELQRKNQVRTTELEEVKMIKEARNR
ncbi:MAG: hypothetical protein FJ358_08350 [Thaumarchaeota archaeon]|nr:hypothetical protein [Nitrososphaerota archaeon]